MHEIFNRLEEAELHLAPILDIGLPELRNHLRCALEKAKILPDQEEYLWQVSIQDDVRPTQDQKTVFLTQRDGATDDASDWSLIVSSSQGKIVLCLFEDVYSLAEYFRANNPLADVDQHWDEARALLAELKARERLNGSSALAGLLSE